MQSEYLKLDDVLNWSKGKLINKKKDTFDFIGTDSRADLAGKLFIPLRGDSFDGHSFIKMAVDKGCAGVVFDSKSKVPVEFDKNGPATLIRVEDTLQALQDIAHGYRKKLNKTIVSITGSVGKTTAKEFAAQILNTYKTTYYSKGSLNNHWGVPFSLLNMRTSDHFGVIEMGMSNYGEIQRLVEIADPDVVVCTMVGVAHFEYFGSQENIAKAKNEIYQTARPDAIRIYNVDDPFTKKMMDSYLKSNPQKKPLTFSQTNSDADVFLQLKKVSSEGLVVEGSIAGVKGSALVPVFGKHNITNVLAAASLAVAVGMPANSIWAALVQLKTNWGRNQLLKSDQGAQVIFDGYNANPDSMHSLIENVNETPVAGKRVLILAEMLELGDTKDKFHFELGKKIKERNFDEVVFYGPSWQKFKEAFGADFGKPKVYASEKMDESLINSIKTGYKSGDLIAIKGSRGMKTEKVVSLLVQAFSHEKI
jgi:UDP-N-acetylmuramoyl-tripeptide--D-alanyl-D-alanine ligase